MARGLAAGGNLDIDDKYHLSCRIIALLTTGVSLLQLVLGTVQVFTDEVFSVDRYEPPFSPGGRHYAPSPQPPFLQWQGGRFAPICLNPGLG